MRPGVPNLVQGHLLQQAHLCQKWVRACGEGLPGDLKPAEVRDGALGIHTAYSTTSPKTQLPVLNQVVVFCNKKVSTGTGMSGDMTGGGYLSFLKVAGVGITGGVINSHATFGGWHECPMLANIAQ